MFNFIFSVNKPEIIEALQKGIRTLIKGRFNMSDYKIVLKENIVLVLTKDGKRKMKLRPSIETELIEIGFEIK